MHEVNKRGNELYLGLPRSIIRLEEHSELLLGPALTDGQSRIMVSLPEEAATNHTFVYDLIEAGVEIMRINCSHGDPSQWSPMIRFIRQAESFHKKKY